MDKYNGWLVFELGGTVIEHKWTGVELSVIEEDYGMVVSDKLISFSYHLMMEDK